MTAVRFLFAICLALAGSIQCYSEDEVKAKGIELFLQCAEGQNVTKEDVEKLQNEELPENENMKCILACLYRKFNSIDDQGLFTPDKGSETGKELYADAPEEKLATIKEVSHICVKVNELPVSDGAKGCDRAGQIFTCLHEEAKKLGVKIY